jgi:cytoskeleton protein RodZ
MSDDPAGVAGVSAGTLLRQAREAAGLHVSTLAANLKVPVRKLEALEEDRYEELPDAVFVRALASSVCRTLKIDPAPVLQRLPQTPQPRLADSGQAINAPFRSPSDGPPPGMLNQVSRPVLLTVVVLLLGALVLIFLPLVQRGWDTVAQANRSEAPPPPAPVPGEARPEQPTTEPALAGTSVAGLPGAPASAAGAVPTAAAITQAPEGAASTGNGVQLRTSASTAAAPPASAATAPASAPVAAASPNAGTGVVVFRTRAQSWVQVKDARGTTVLQKLMEPGETAGADGALPLSVVVGSVQNTEVQVRGKPFDLAPLARDNVARFEVK